MDVMWEQKYRYMKEEGNIMKTGKIIDPTSPNIILQLREHRPKEKQ